MFTTNQDVMDATGYADVTPAQVKQAQFVIETYIGRDESMVDGARDKSILSRAVIAQTVYMRNNPEISFEQIAASTIQAGGELTTFKAGDWTAPFIAPLAVMACRGLSWAGSKSVSVGKAIQNNGPRYDWSRD